MNQTLFQRTSKEATTSRNEQDLRKGKDKISDKVGDGSSSLVKTLTAPIGWSLKEEELNKILLREIQTNILREYSKVLMWCLPSCIIYTFLHHDTPKPYRLTIFANPTGTQQNMTLLWSSITWRSSPVLQHISATLIYATFDYTKYLLVTVATTNVISNPIWKYDVK